MPNPKPSDATQRLYAEGWFRYAEAYAYGARNLIGERTGGGGTIYEIGPCCFAIGHALELPGKSVLVFEGMSEKELRKRGHKIFDIVLETVEKLGFNRFQQEHQNRCASLEIPEVVLLQCLENGTNPGAFYEFFGHVSNLYYRFGEPPYDVRYFRSGSFVTPDLRILNIGVVLLEEMVANHLGIEQSSQ